MATRDEVVEFWMKVWEGVGKTREELFDQIRWWEMKHGIAISDSEAGRLVSDLLSRLGDEPMRIVALGIAKEGLRIFREGKGSIGSPDSSALA